MLNFVKMPLFTKLKGDPMKLKYLPLFKIYHQDPDHWDAIRDQRYNFEFSTRLPIEIKEYGREKTYDAFFGYTNELVEQLQEVSTQGELLRTLIEHLPSQIGDIIFRALHTVWLPAQKSDAEYS